VGLKSGATVRFVHYLDSRAVSSRARLLRTSETLLRFFPSRKPSRTKIDSPQPKYIAMRAAGLSNNTGSARLIPILLPTGSPASSRLETVELKAFRGPLGRRSRHPHRALRSARLPLQPQSPDPLDRCHDLHHLRDAAGNILRTLARSYPANFFQQTDVLSFLGGLSLAANQTVTEDVVSGSLFVCGATADARTTSRSISHRAFRCRATPT
jgi:hypothetical protein